MIYLTIGCIFGAILFSINAAYGNKDAKIIRNVLAIIGVVSFLIQIVVGVVTKSQEVVPIMMTGSALFMLIGGMLGLIASYDCGAGSDMAKKVAFVLVVAGLTFVMFGLLILLTTKI